MKVKTQKKIKKEAGLLIVPFFKDYKGSYPKIYTEELKNLLKKPLKEKEFEGKDNETLYFTTDSKTLSEKVLFISGGDVDKFGAESARNFGATICKEAKSRNQQKLIILLTPELNLYVKELFEGIALANYRVSKYKTGEDYEKEKNKDIAEVILATTKLDEAKLSAEQGLTIAQAVNITKDLINGPANIVDADYFEKIARELCRDNGYSLTVINKQKLIKEKWGGLLAINQGAFKPAKCLVLKYNGGKRKDKPIVIVGKGVIFDTGGYNLKPTRYIEDMHSDKAGASAVIGIFAALKELKIKQNMVGIIPLTENMIDGKAIRPSDIVTMYNGKTVEVTNTDAEGRMILADGLSYGAKLKPKYLLDIATLTGAAMAALGDRYAGVMGNDDKLNQLLIKAGEETDELMWQLPLHKDHKEKMKSKVADLRNCDNGTAHLAGASKGAAFLENFIGDRKWAHIDIAGTAYTKDPKKYEQNGGTGSGVRSLLKFFSDL